jgi:hypothetical protein
MRFFKYLKEFLPEMFIIAVLKKTEEANNFRSALSALLRESFINETGITQFILSETV